MGERVFFRCASAVSDGEHVEHGERGEVAGSASDEPQLKVAVRLQIRMLTKGCRGQASSR